MKKRIISIVLIIAMSFALWVPSTALTQEQRNHKFVLNDVLTILKHLSGVAPLNISQRALYNVTNSPGVGMTDVLEILKHLAGAASVFGPARTPTPATHAAEVVRLVNVERAKAGLSPLSATNNQLNNAAMKRADEIRVDYRSDHSRPDGRAWSTVLPEFNVSYRAAGENIAQGQSSPQEVVTAWMNSPGHRRNIMNPDFTHIGVGVAQGTGTRGDIRWSWVQLFIRV